ncbi:het domain-containing protein [Colletotrichum scovillei]|uniref:Het domain-containing protein n=2 Tax=Colletotrichum scovillei TaxID=1209932 RepID=A0A9P7R282_9PEZI|nr:het domain-containing protein [Colletotrichum scovillei]
MKDGSRFEVEIFSLEGDPIPATCESIPTMRRTSKGTDSDSALDTIKSWIDICLGSSHGFCESPEEPLLPSRVLDVGHDKDVIRLIDSKSQHANYTALSHCWGRKQIITSTKATLAQRQTGIRLTELSNTFRDAVLLTRRLGIKYIWIDSLCIIQDCKSDWEAESAKMADVYSNAYLTIAATQSHDGDGGLFVNAPDFEVSDTTLPTTSGDPYRLFFRRRVDHHLEVVTVVVTADQGDPTSSFHPLLTRAWVYQERMLSTRVLHFGPHEIFFECRSDLFCECGRIQYYGSSDSVPIAITKLLHSSALDSEMEGYDWADVASYFIARLWRTLITSYTALDLTMISDRLPAIGGLAKHMAARRKSTYLAGIWKDTINDDLLWIIPTTLKNPRPSPRTAPTWSWASVDSSVDVWDAVFFWDPDLDYEEDSRGLYEHNSTVVDCQVTPSGVDNYGGIAHGLLRISGLIVDGVLERDTVIRHGKETTVHYVVVSTGRFRIDADYALDSPGPDQVLPGAAILCLRMSFIQDGPSDNFKLISLVLRESKQQPGKYERIGCFFIQSTTPPNDLQRSMYASGSVRTVDIV